jgi:hypothetical protein
MDWIEVWGFFVFLNYGMQICFQMFRGPYAKIHRQWGFRVDCYEIQGLLGKSWTANIFFLKIRGSYVKSWLQTYFLEGLGVNM